MTYAPPADVATHGPYGPDRVKASIAARRPVYPFQGRVGTPLFPAAPGRYHLYVSWTCPYAQRAAIVRELAGLRDVVSLSYVDDERDALGWAFRARRGADPVNGFRYLSEAYEATEPGYPGHISVPVLWDTRSRRIVSNNYPDITLDLATRFTPWADSSVELYPERLRGRIDALNDEIFTDVNDAVGKAGSPDPKTAAPARARLFAAFARYDAVLAAHPYLLGDALTESDVRLWVSLVRYDSVYNADARISADSLAAYPSLAAYTSRLLELPAFASTTDPSLTPLAR
ncbi:glutathione S-transferase C-terminal domain-containing protein [Actinocorallia sp. A-T 12471]|uniref:glutathione S-transferase C-terminal domain-containing protein n=1 Tax=Actinocorallia sp. A-T 12471 TaxID=3089813 RepID=UPI0029D19014|nr:glutathione S-transferase C-terminal domain-containing protein [Actinocorallia sp. A-T 12471]MDX6741102.1 glutathione S-transferase C-terminal domain-containing protein [Actinocorallia sp. A-T 12471]